LLTNTFLHIPGVGPTTERALWKHGLACWQDLLDNLDDAPLGTASREDARRTLHESLECFECKKHQYFAKALGLSEAWRAWPDFSDSTVYLDIETDGGQSGQAVTVIGLYDSNGFRALVKGDDIESFLDVISHYSMIVTFFGSGFDLPMLQKRFYTLKFDQIHLDLCPTLKRLGYRGGLKKIEKQLGIARDEETDGMNGLDAVRLWRAHLLGDKNALDKLIAYNRDDVVNLVKLAELAYSKLKAAHYDICFPCADQMPAAAETVSV
jgi:uncharacterized protein YprB with RNaseH-like and TPR domain